MNQQHGHMSIAGQAEYKPYPWSTRSAKLTSVTVYVVEGLYIKVDAGESKSAMMLMFIL